MSVRLGLGTEVLAVLVCDASQALNVKEVTIGGMPRC